MEQIQRRFLSTLMDYAIHTWKIIHSMQQVYHVNRFIWLYDTWRGKKVAWMGDFEYISDGKKKKRNANTMKSRYKSGGASLVRNVREGSEGSAFPWALPRKRCPSKSQLFFSFSANVNHENEQRIFPPFFLTTSKSKL